MTGLEISSAFASIVSLIADYKQDAQAERDGKHQEFLEWLEYHRHEEAKAMICNNAALLMEVNQLIRQDTRTLLERIEKIGDTIATVASRLGTFGGIASALAGPNQLHPEAMELLRNFVQHDWRCFGVVGSLGEPQFLIMEGQCGPFEGDMTYFWEDIDRLVDWGFLRDESSDGTKHYRLTRAAAKCFTPVAPPPSQSENQGGSAPVG